MGPWINVTATHPYLILLKLNENDYSGHLGREQTGLTVVFVSFLDVMHSGGKDDITDFLCWFI